MVPFCACSSKAAHQLACKRRTDSDRMWPLQDSWCGVIQDERLRPSGCQDAPQTLFARSRYLQNLMTTFQV